MGKTKRQNPKPAPASTRDAELQVAQKAAKKKLPTKSLRAQFSSMAEPLTHQDAGIMSYMHTIADPWVEEPAGVPLALGNFCRRTVKAQYHVEGQATANASGFAMVAVNCDGWVGDATSLPIRFTTFPTGTPGLPVWYTTSSYANTSVPVFSATTATVGLAGLSAPVIDGQITSTSNIRMVACGLRVFSDASVNTAQGKLAVMATSRPYGPATSGALQGITYATASQLPADVLSFQSEPCAGWKSGHSLHAIAIPTDPTCFEFFNPPAAGTSTLSYPQIGAILSGATFGQTFTFQIVFDYEFDVGVTYVTGQDTLPMVPTHQGDLTGYIDTMKQVSGTTGSGPTVGVRPAGIQGYLAHLALTRPTKLPAVLRPSSGLADALGGAAKQALGWAAQKGLSFLKGALKGVPLIGGAMSMLGL